MIKNHWKKIAIAVIAALLTFVFMNFEVVAWNWAGFANSQPIGAIQSDIHNNVYSIDWQLVPSAEPIFD